MYWGGSPFLIILSMGKEPFFDKIESPHRIFFGAGFQFVEKVHPLPRGEGGPEGVGRGMRAEIQKSAPFKGLLKSWLLDENAHKYLGFLRPKFPPDFLFSLASLDSFPPGEAIGCCRTRGFIDSLKARTEFFSVRALAPCEEVK